MKARWLFGVLVFAGVFVIGTGRVVSQEQGKKSQDGGINPVMMEAWKKIGAPGEFHANLKHLAGKWNYLTKWRMSAAQPWVESKGTAECRWILGGRFLQQVVKGEPTDQGGERFEGYGLTGYDNGSKAYTSVWIDNMGTGTMISQGTCDASGKVFTYSGTSTDPFTGLPKKEKSVVRIINVDKHVMEIFSVGPDGREFKSLIVSYSRI